MNVTQEMGAWAEKTAKERPNEVQVVFRGRREVEKKDITAIRDAFDPGPKVSLDGEIETW